MSEPLRLGPAEVGALLGLREEAAERHLARCAPDLRYVTLSREERDATVLRVVQTLQSGDLQRAGPARSPVWEAGWRENLEEIRKQGFRSDLLRPRYFRRDLVRYDGDWVRPLGPLFETDLFGVIRGAVFERYLSDSESIVELGCGTGANLLDLAELCPRAELVGCDWATSSQELLDVISAEIGREIRGVHFDMFDPHGSAPLPGGKGCSVLTVHAFEQLGVDFGPMLEYLLALAPERCVQIEPVAELYDPDALHDWLALEYHRRRGYLDGYLDALRALERAGRVEIEEARRVRFGSLFHEGYNLLVWRVR